VERYIIWFSDCSRELLPRVGGKNASLGEMTKAGMAVPPGFAITTEAYDDFLTEAGIKPKIEKILKEVPAESATAMEEASQAVCQLMAAVPLPKRVEKAISDSYEKLGERCGVTDVPVAVRSSATAEDLPGASFAGQQETFLWVIGSHNVLEKFQRCCSSLYTGRAISYRIRMGFPHEKVLISTGVQKMVNAKVAGVMFTLNPLNGDPSKVVVEASWGLGESVVSGEVTPDSYLVDKVTKDILKRTISQKATEHVLDPSRSQAVCLDVPPERQGCPCLPDEEVLALVRLAVLIERYFGKPQDIEWAIDRGLPFPDNIFILQSRPETVWSQKRGKGPTLAPKASILEIMIDQLKEGG